MNLLKTLINIYGDKPKYSQAQISTAENVLNSDKSKHRYDDKYLFFVNNPTHKWYLKLVSSTMIEDSEGWVIIRRGANIDKIKPKFLVK